MSFLPVSQVFIVSRDLSDFMQEVLCMNCQNMTVHPTTVLNQLEHVF